MSTISPPSTPSRTPAPGHGRRWFIGAAVLGLVAACALLLLVARGMNRAVPAFPGLADAPDTSVQGTVAYYADATSCVRIIAASGRPAKDVYCIPDQDVGQAVKLGKLVGPQLRWLPGGQLEITMFRLTDPPGPGFRPGWQKVVAVRTGTSQDVPDAPAAPATGTQPTVTPDGRRVTFSSENDGRVRVVLHEHGTRRTLLNVHGPGEGTYRLASAFWAPTWQWIAADDGRILVITPGQPALTRVLTSESVRGGYGGYPRFSVTAENLLSE